MIPWISVVCLQQNFVSSASTLTIKRLPPLVSGGGNNHFIWLLEHLRTEGWGNLILKKQISSLFLHKWKPCSLYLFLPEVSHYPPTNCPISHGSTHVGDTFRIFPGRPNCLSTRAVIRLPIFLQMFQAVFPELQVCDIKLEQISFDVKFKGHSVREGWHRVWPSIWGHCRYCGSKLERLYACPRACGSHSQLLTTVSERYSVPNFVISNNDFLDFNEDSSHQGIRASYPKFLVDTSQRLPFPSLYSNCLQIAKFPVTHPKMH